ncbi:MAG: hypothetical protein EHM93_19745 [Bacteroidales bacterium]|nr:MAG: hypothetical protein EHM93_19745 [Bacteroidales bacterium]
MIKLSKRSIAIIVCITVGVFMSCKKDVSETETQITVTEDTPVIDYDGNTYRTIKIGNQIWMAENLRSTHYSDGSPIPNFTYNNSEADAETYGRLYSWAAVMKGSASSNSNPSNVQGVAPLGWHVPSRAEWQQLIDYLGGVGVAGGKLKESGNSHWLNSNIGTTNESKFTALPAGFYAFWNEFKWRGDYCAFSTTTDASVSGHPACITVKLDYDNIQATVGQFHPNDAISVRCVKN